MTLDLTKEELAAALELINKGVLASMPPAWAALLNKMALAQKAPDTEKTPPE